MPTPAPPACLTCAFFWFDAETPSCTAFPERIPDSIWMQGDPHDEPVDGDSGITYKPALGQ